MKRIKLLILILLILLLTACKKDDLILTARVDAPVLEKAPIEGKWHIEKIIPLRENTHIREEIYNLLGKKAGFSVQGVFIADDYISEPAYSVRRVNATEFLKSKYNISANQFSFNNKKIDIVTIYNNEQPYFEILLEKNDLAYLHHGDIFLVLQRDDENISKDEIKKSINENKSIDRAQGSIQETENTLILGTRTYKYDEKNNLPSWVYNTFCIRFKDGLPISMTKMENLITPRNSGFWEVYTERTKDEKLTYDTIVALPLGSGLKMNKAIETKKMEDTEKSLKAITFVGSSFMSLENINQEGNVMSFAVHSLDNIDSKALKLSDIIADGDKDFIESAGVNQKLSKADYDTTNFGLFRDKGIWALKGKIANGAENSSQDFIIYNIAPKEFINYNEFQASYEEISSKVSELEDAFLSINGKNLILLVNDGLRIYNINNFDEYIDYKLPPNTTPVMSEWSIGRYSEIWSKEFENMPGAETISFEN
ncbi:MAG: hypothetical protein Q4P29_04620 [Tissierellia bacterium]|nr:hypothetical protein [Tissierellia bacterium]